MAARALLFTLLAACAGTTRTATVREPPPPAEVRVQLDVPPNAPGEDHDLDVGLFRVGSTEARVALDPGGTLYVVSRLAVEPADTRLYRLDPTALVPVELPDS